MTQTVEANDVQSLVFSSHAPLRHALAAGLTVGEGPTARAALRAVVEEKVSFGLPPKGRSASAQLLVSAAGLKALGVPNAALREFGRPFQQGIVTPQRSRALGDSGRNRPDHWSWRDGHTHALLLVYHTDPGGVEAECADLLRRLAPGWQPGSPPLAIRLPPDEREHFGFRDGLAGAHVDLGDGSAPGPGLDLLPAGEVLLGYRNALGVINAAPPLGRNGAYVVVRQLEQDVEGFWRYWRQQGGSDERAVWLAAKAVGRWPNGMPVTGSHSRPEPSYDETEARRTLSFRGDPLGDQCPLGAHVRRANPRDGLAGSPKRSLVVAAQHRIVRRGRVYGPPAPGEWLPANVRRATHESAEGAPGHSRGLFFVCLCGDIARQFEFIQQTWLNDPDHSGRGDEVDPIAAGEGIDGDGKRFSIPRDPLRLRLNGVLRWVTVRGGGYFLLAGRRALRALLADGTPSG